MELQTVDEKPLIACRWRPYYPVADLQGKIVEVVQAVHPDYLSCLMAVPYPLLKQFDPGQLPPGTALGLEHPLASRMETLPAASLANLFTGAQAAYVTVGDQSNRMVFHETDEEVHWQLEQVLACGLNVLLCIQQPATQLKHYLSGLVPEQLAKIIVVLQGNWPSYYAGDALIPEMQAALNDFRLCQERLKGLAKIPMLLSLPAQIDSTGELVAATLPHCRGYYFTSASTHVAQLLDLLHQVVIQAQTRAAQQVLEQPTAPVVPCHEEEDDRPT